MDKKVDQTKENALKTQRDDEKLKHEEGTLELIIDEKRKNDDAQSIEKKLRDQKHKNSPNQTAEGVMEKRLNDASKANYPHRNEDAWERTGEKRPVNALDEEMGSAGDASKVKRYEAKSKPGESRVVDKDVGKQRTAFNLKRKLEAAALAKEQESVGDYLVYKDQASPWAIELQEVKQLDSTMTTILAESSGRSLTKDEMAKIAALKSRKSELLKVAKKL